MNYLYLIIDLAVLLIPLIFSFHPKLKFHKKWKSTYLSIGAVAIPFIIWDIIFAEIGVWGFNMDYLTGIYFFNLPIEEVLFFICIPYACLFTYHCFQKMFNFSNRLKIPFVVGLLFSIVIISIGIANFQNWYTTSAFILSGILFLMVNVFYKPSWNSNFNFSFIILLIPFLITNGILTGSGLVNPIVWYNLNEILGFRIFTIPIEDFAYCYSMLIGNVWIYEKLESIQAVSPSISHANL